MAQDHLYWKNGINNEFSPSSLTDAEDGDGFYATAVISSVTTISSFRMSQYDAYQDLFEKLHQGQTNVLPQHTTTEKNALTGIYDGVSVLDITLGREDICFEGAFVGASGETGGIVHLPTSTVTTEDNTQTVLAAVTLDENSAYLFTAEIIGEVLDHSIVLGSIIECTAKRVTGGSAVIVGNVSETHDGKDSGAASWSVTFTVSGNDLRISVTGGNATLVMWESDLNYLKF